jgi:hypothetical protein
MLNAKTYTVAYSVACTVGMLTYGYNVRYAKWEYHWNDPANGSQTLLVKCKSGQAHKVANVLLGSFKRSGCLDNLARKNISQITGNN